MKISETWLREWVNPRIDTTQLSEQLTLAGLEVEAVDSAAPEFKRVVVGLIKITEKHPQADRLSVCRVDVGHGSQVDIVCGGSNVRPGLKVAVVLVDGEIAGGIKIKKAALRGVTSHGMICSGRELGLSEADEQKRILELPDDAPIGKNLRDYLSLDDAVIDINLTPNRGDCLSIRGIAREVGALNRLRVKAPTIIRKPPKIKDRLTVKVSAKKACPRYLGRVIREINPRASTPIWMRERLRRSGVRSVHPVVDITNYVMIELGQPLHAFDGDKLRGGVEVRYAKRGESITIIDGKTVTLEDRDLVIADKEHIQAIAGIMGGASSAIGSETQNIFLESAFFNPGGIALSARRLGIQSESSYRFERGVDYLLQKDAMDRATELLLLICGGKAGPIVECRAAAALPKSKMLTLRRDQIERLLGIRIPDSDVKRILLSLGMGITAISSGWKIRVPSYRFDLNQEVDLIEECARLYGYDRIPAAAMSGTFEIPLIPESRVPTPRIRRMMVDHGYFEAITYSFVDDQLQRLLNPAVTAIPLANPLSSDMSVLRSSLWPGLIQVLTYNQSRQIQRVRLFEIGMCFASVEGEWRQIIRLGGLVAGDAHSLQWGEKSRPVGFFDVKGDVASLLALTLQPDTYRFVAESHPALHPGQSTAIYHGDRRIGYLGALHPDLQNQLKVEGVPYLFELELESIAIRRLPRYQAISRFPAIRRDIAVVVDQELEVGAIQREIVDSAGQLLNMVEIFDIYAGEGIEFGKKSVAMGLTFQHPSRTLIDEEINQVIERVVNILERTFNAKLRA